MEEPGVKIKKKSCSILFVFIKKMPIFVISINM